MSRSPWREALDGQAKILRELRKITSNIHLARNADIQPVRDAYPDPVKRAEVLVAAGNTLADAVSILVREAEPVYLSHDIEQAVVRRMGIVAKAKNPFQPLTEAMLPIPHGLIWFGNRGMEISDIPHIPHVGGGDVGSIRLLAIYFGEDLALSMRTEPLTKRLAIETRTRETYQPFTTMGIMGFLDARASGYENMVSVEGDHIVPVLLGGWNFGETLIEYTARHGDIDRAIGVNVEGTNVLLALLGGFLEQLFLLMLQRVTRWGGVGLNRTEQQQAERDGLRPRVQLVTWRKADYKYPEGHIPVPKNWSCRWSVREHYRRYKNGKIVKILPYIKGPQDRPFRGPDQRVHQVKQ